MNEVELDLRIADEIAILLSAIAFLIRWYVTRPKT